MVQLAWKRWIGFVATVPGIGMSFLDQTILPVAIPTIRQEMGASTVALQWCVNSYLLAIAIFTLTGGKLGDRWGHRKIYLLGMLIFVFFSFLCGISPNVEFLIGARALQGLGAALMFPSQTALFANLFPPHARGRATGMSVSIGSIFMILGPLIGGYLTEALSWRYIFWMNVPLAAVGICLILIFFPPSHPGKGKIDGWGFGFFAICVAATTIFFMQTQEWSFFSLKSILCVGLAIIALVFLIGREKRANHPFLDLALFKRPIFAAINLSISIAQFIMMVAVFRTVYIEEILGFSPSQTGIIISVSSLPVLFFSLIGGYLSDKVSPRLPIFLGYLCLIFSFFWLGVFNTPSLPSLFTASLLFGMGIPLILTPSYSAAMSAVPLEKLGVAFGTIATLRWLSATIGLALISLFVDFVQKIRLPTEGKRLAEIASFSAIHFLLGFLLIATFAGSFFLYSRKSAHHAPSSPAEGWD